MEITIKVHGEEHTHKTDHDEHDIYQMGEILARMLISIGYGYENVKDLFTDGENMI